MPNPNSYVLDSYALIGYLENESFSDRIQQAFTQAKKGALRLYLHAIHIGEVYYIILREQGRNVADLAYSRINPVVAKAQDAPNPRRPRAKPSRLGRDCEPLATQEMGHPGLSLRAKNMTNILFVLEVTKCLFGKQIQKS